jgi:hypothetical protein
MCSNKLGANVNLDIISCLIVIPPTPQPNVNHCGEKLMVFIHRFLTIGIGI